MVKQKRLFIISLLLLMLTGCGMSEELTDWAAEKANDALEVVGGGVQEAIDDLKNAEYQDGPFENNLESARAYLLAQLQEKYGIEFIVAGDEDLENYGLFAGATYTGLLGTCDNRSCISDNVSRCPGWICCLLLQGRG